ALIASLAAWIDSGAPANTGSGSELFSQRVRPVLEQQCLACHGGKFKQAGLSLLSRETLLRGSDNGPVVDPENAGSSLLIRKLRHQHQPGMPYQAAKLPAEVIDRVEQWVKEGAPY